MTWQVAALEPLEDSTQVPAVGVKLPEPLAVKVTVPLGLVAPDAEISVTVAVQVVAVPTTTDPGEQLTLVVVG